MRPWDNNSTLTGALSIYPKALPSQSCLWDSITLFFSFNWFSVPSLQSLLKKMKIQLSEPWRLFQATLFMNPTLSLRTSFLHSLLTLQLFRNRYSLYLFTHAQAKLIWGFFLFYFWNVFLFALVVRLMNCQLSRTHLRHQLLGSSTLRRMFWHVGKPSQVTLFNHDLIICAVWYQLQILNWFPRLNSSYTSVFPAYSMWIFIVFFTTIIYQVESFILP